MGLRNFVFLAVLGTAMHAAPGSAAMLEWPGSSCAGTLQACIDGAAAGDIIEIATPGPIDEAPVIDNSLTLRAKLGLRPVFAAGRDIRALPPLDSSGEFAVTIQGLNLTDARVLLQELAATRTANFRVEDVEIDSKDPTRRAGIELLIGHGTNLHRAFVSGNRLRVGTVNPFVSAIDAIIISAPVDIDLHYNRVLSVGPSQGTGIEVQSLDRATTTVRMLANLVRGPFVRGGIAVTEGVSGFAPSTVTARLFSNVVIGERDQFGGGIQHLVYSGTIATVIANNTTTQTDGVALRRYSTAGGDPPATGTISGSIQNNLVVGTRFGILNDARTGSLASNDYNLQFKTQFPQPGAYTLGPHDLSADPLLRSPDYPRLNPSSPARDAGNTIALLGSSGLPGVDGDGLRRVAGTAVDIGAYEYGHRALLTVAPEVPGTNSTAIDDPITANDPAARLFATTNYEAMSVANPRPIGVYRIPAPSVLAGWRVFNQAPAANMPGFAAFNVFAPVSAPGLFLHTATPTRKGAAHFSVIDESSVNGNGERFLLATQNWNGDGAAGIYNDHPIALSYGALRWAIVNADGAAIPAGAKFNIYSQPRSPNAFVHEVRADNIVGSRRTNLDHPLLNGNACAQFQVTPYFSGTAAGAIFDTDYSVSSERWAIVAPVPTPGLALGARYHVLVIPEQVEDCTIGALFRDQFESPN
jgi:hypothetical protein